MKTKVKTMLMSLLMCSVCCAQHIKPRPSFPGGYKALQEFIEKEKKYPDEALKKREEGAVYVVFTVDTLGNVVHPKVATNRTAEIYVIIGINQQERFRHRLLWI